MIPSAVEGSRRESLKIISPGSLDCGRDDSVENTKGNRGRYSATPAVDARIGRVRKIRRRLCNSPGHSTRTGVPAIAARLLLSGCGRKREANWAACLLLRRLDVSGKTKPRGERALRCRRPSEQGRWQTLNESRRAGGGTRRQRIIARQPILVFAQPPIFSPAHRGA